MFGKLKWVACVVGWGPLLLIPINLFLYFGYGPGSFAHDMLIFTGIMATALTIIGMIWFIVLVILHPRMSKAPRGWRILFLVLYYPFTAPFVYRALSDDPHAAQKKTLTLD